MAQYDSVDSFVSDYKTQNPQFKDIGPQTLYSVLVKEHPNTPSLIEGSPTPEITDWTSAVASFKSVNPELKDVPDIDVANSLRDSLPILKVFDAPPETPDQRFAIRPSSSGTSWTPGNRCRYFALRRS